MDRGPNTQRDLAFDAVKGILVLLMVVYHVLSIASMAGEEAFRYIRFISGSFIFISGFVVSCFLSERFRQQPGATSRKLILRGAKVLLIFTLLNAAIQLSGFGNVSKQQLGLQGFLAQAWTIYIVGDGRISSFVILLPIAYTLMLAPVALFLWSSGRAWWPAAVLVVTLTLAAIPSVAAQSMNTEFMLVGFCGLAMGAPALAGRLVSKRSLPLAAAVTGLVLSVWLTGWYGGQLVLYCAGVALVLRFLYDLVRVADESSPGTRIICMIGRYSLVAYIAQIAIIQTIFRVYAKSRLELGFEQVVMYLATAFGLVILCVVLERIRASSGLADRSYRWIFS